MRVLVIYESMYGNTRAIAEAIGSSLGTEADVVPVREASPERVAVADLLVVGAPTHIRGMSRPSSRKAARDAASKPDSTVSLEPGADGTGLREWFADLGTLSCRAAAFDTRVDMPAIVSGRAASHIARLLRRHGAQLVTPPRSFVVDKQNRLLDGEQVRARLWGEDLARAVRSVANTS
jgi:capsular polysaccharide biosynthesis protein